MRRRVLVGIIALWTVLGAPAQRLNELVETGDQATRDGRYAEAVRAYRDALQAADPYHPNFQRLEVVLLLKEAAARLADEGPLSALQPVKRARLLDEHHPEVQRLWKMLQLGLGDKTVSATEISRALGVARSFKPMAGKPPAVDVPVSFRFDSAGLTAQGKQQAAEMLASMREETFKGERFRLVGHTDTQGSADYNLGLSRRRAESLREWFLARSDLDAGRIETRGLGESAPLMKGDSEAEHARNRRVELQLLP